jgi:hypothetical protein
MEFISTLIVNHLKNSGDLYVPLTLTATKSTFCPQSVFMGFVWFSEKTVIISLNSVNQLIFVMVKCGVFFAVRNEFLNTI